MSALNTPEFYKDLVQTNVAGGGYTAASGVLNVASTALPFSQTQQMHVTIVDVTTFAVKAVLKLTALNSSTQWACTADSSNDGNANAGDIVRLSLTEKAMDQIIADINQEGTYASLPGTTGQKTGYRYRQTDGPGYDWRFNGTIWVPWLSMFGKLTIPPSAGWTWDNQGSGTFSNTYGSLRLFSPRSGSLAVRMLYRTAPATPWTVTVLLRADNQGAGISGSSGHDMAFGLAFRNSGGKIMNYVIEENAITNQLWNSSTSFNTTDVSYNGTTYQTWAIAGRNGIWMRIQDNGTNILCDWSLNGQDWTNFNTRARAGFLTGGPNAYGLGTYINGTPIEMEVLSLLES